MHWFARSCSEDNPSSKTTAPASSDSERPKSEVDKQLEEAKKHGELVLVRCLQDCDGEKIEGEVEPGRALELAKPDFPAIARRAHASGQVIVQLIIDTDGKVIAAAAVSGHPLLYGVSVAAARNTRFHLLNSRANL